MKKKPKKMLSESLIQQNKDLNKGISWESCRMFTGYNRLIAKKGALFLARVKEFGDPFLAVQTFGKGRSMAFASDISPHWGAGFQKWDNYGKFFVQAVRWLGSAE